MDPELLKKFEALYHTWCNDIVAFAEMMGTKPWSGQEQLLRAYQDLVTNDDHEGARRLIVKSAQGVGKTRSMAVAALWFFFRSKDALVIITAPTDRQCKSVYFSEVRRVLAEGPEFMRDMVEVTATQLTMRGRPVWRMLGVTASSPEAAAGWHAKHMSIFIEEVSGMDDAVLEAFIGTASGPQDVIAAIGNPTKTEGMLFKAFEGGPKMAKAWPFRLTLSKLTLSQERPDLASPKTIDTLRDEHGEDSDFYRVRVLGEFPSQSGQTILNFADIQRAVETPVWKGIKGGTDPHLRRIGIDFAREGGDKNAVAMRQGNAIVALWSDVCEPVEALEKAREMQAEWGWSDESCLWVLDVVGIGQGMIEPARRMGKIIMEYGSHFKAPVIEYDDLQTHAWYRLREIVSHQIAHLPASDDPEGLIQQLALRHSGINDRTGKIRVESKKDYKRRTGMTSPDEGDAVIQCFAADDQIALPSGQAIL